MHASTALVPVFAGTLQDQSTQLCNASDLHAFLEVDTRFNDWIARRIEQYGFTDGEDFCSILSKTRGRPRTDYHLTLDMAKELAMVENNEKGRQVRRYFIALERQARAPTPAEPTPALPQKDRVSRNLRQAINRKAHEVAVKQYDTIHAIITDAVQDNLACGASEEKALGYVETYGNGADGTVVVNARDLFGLVWHTQQAIDTAARSMAAIQRIEQHIGRKLALRQERSRFADPDWRGNDSLITEVIDRMAGAHHPFAEPEGDPS